MKRALRLNRERLSELTVDDLRAVAGGTVEQTMPLVECLFSRRVQTCLCCTATDSCD